MTGLAAVLALIAAVPAAAQAGTAAAPQAPSGTAADGTSVTLITGDRVTLSAQGDGSPSIRRGSGRAGVTFLTQRADGDLLVVPTDAVDLLHSGRVDARLFDVTELIRLGDDDRRTDLPLVLDAGSGSVDRAALTAAGGVAGREQASAGAVAMSENRGQAAAFWRTLTTGAAHGSLRAGIARVSLDATDGTTAVFGRVFDPRPEVRSDSVGASDAQDADTLTIRHLDRSGQPATDYTTIVTGIDTDYSTDLYDPSGTATVTLPAGRYLLATFIPNGPDDPNAGTMLVQPLLQLTGDQTVVLDARLGRPLSISVPEPDATAVQAVIGFNQQLATGDTYTGSMLADGPERQYTAQIGGTASVDGFTGLISTDWARLDADGAIVDSPYGYHLAWYDRGGMWTGLDRHPTRASLARVQEHYALATPGAQLETIDSNQLPGVVFGLSWGGADFYGSLPGTRTDYYNTDDGVRWQSWMGEEFPDGDGDGQTATPVAYQAGATYQRDWNRGVFGPDFPTRPDPALWVTRTGDDLLAWLPWFGDAAGNEGDSTVGTSRIAVSRDGVTVGESTDSVLGDFTLPADPGRYQLEVDTTRGAPFTLSTQTSTVWTFDSTHPDGTDPVALPLSVPRFTPALDDHNSAPAGCTFTVPVTVQQQPGSAAGASRTLTVDVSYDDGATWQPAALRRTPTGGLAMVRNPAGTGYVSLRANATDTAGNTVSETIIHAYAF